MIAEALARAAAVILGAERVALACHVHPDGDALGSMLALHHTLRGAGLESVAGYGGPQTIGAHYRELPGQESLTHPGRFPTEPEVMVTLDCGSLDRLGDLGPVAAAAKELVVIDHHVSNTGFGSVKLVDTAAAASAVVVARLIDEMNLPLNRDAAICLYAALVCDTGRFQFDCTGPEAFDLARRLIDFDIPVATLNRSLFEEHRLAYLRLVGEVLGRATFVPECRFIWAAVTQSDLGAHDVAFEETEGLIDFLRRAREAEVSCVVKEAGDGSLRVSLRSLGRVDASEVAVRHGGGGHRFAAGFDAHTSVDDIVGAIRSDLASLDGR